MRRFNGQRAGFTHFCSEGSHISAKVKTSGIAFCPRVKIKILEIICINSKKNFRINKVKVLPENSLAEDELFDQVDKNVQGIEAQRPLVLFLVHECGKVVLLHSQLQV